MESLDSALFEEVAKDAPASLILCSRKSCHIWQGVHPLIHELEENYAGHGIGFYHLDVEEQPALFQSLKGKGVPQVLYYRFGELRERLVGEHSLDEYAEKLEEIFEEGD